MAVTVGQVLDESLDGTEIFEEILHSRNLKNSSQIEKFLHPELPTLEELLVKIPVDQKSLAHAKKLIMTSIKEGKDILVFGDYDADGLTSTTVMWVTLMGLARGSSARVLPFIPDRHRHGYGLSDKALSDLADGSAFASTAYPDFHPDLIITVDNGIVAVKEVGILKEKGIKVVVTDHHQIGEALPPADVIIHSTITSGAGISYLSSLYFSDSHPAVIKMLEIATIGIVADQMPLIGVNRDLVVAGLKGLTGDNFPGLSALKKSAGISGRTLTTYDINFAIAPRLNAVGRLDNPLDGLRLLCTRDHKQAERLAEVIETHNKNRQEFTDRAIAHALSSQVEHNIIVVSSKSYHEGIIGLVAGKLMEKFHRPAIAIAEGEDVSKGSARSLPGINITNILRQFPKLFLGLGGHEQAAGFSLKTENIDKLKTKLFAYADKHIDSSQLTNNVTADFGITLKQTSLTLARSLARLEPFGIGNARPKFCFENLHVLESRALGAGGKHLKLVVEQNGITRDAIYFNYIGTAPKFIKNLVGTLDVNTYRERDNLQIMVSYVET